MPVENDILICSFARAFRCGHDNNFSSSHFCPSSPAQRQKISLREIRRRQIAKTLVRETLPHQPSRLVVGR